MWLLLAAAVVCVTRMRLQARNAYMHSVNADMYRVLLCPIDGRPAGALLVACPHLVHKCPLNLLHMLTATLPPDHPFCIPNLNPYNLSPRYHHQLPQPSHVLLRILPCLPPMEGASTLSAPSTHDPHNPPAPPRLLCGNPRLAQLLWLPCLPRRTCPLQDVPPPSGNFSVGCRRRARQEV